MVAREGAAVALRLEPSRLPAGSFDGHAPIAMLPAPSALRNDERAADAQLRPAILTSADTDRTPAADADTSGACLGAPVLNIAIPNSPFGWGNGERASLVSASLLASTAIVAPPIVGFTQRLPLAPVVPWHEVRWIGFSDDNDALSQVWHAAADTPLARIAADRRLPVPAGTDGEATVDRAAALWQRLGAGIGRLLRYGAVAASVGLAVVVYRGGGGPLFGVVEAMPRPLAAHDRQASAALVPTIPRSPTAPATPLSDANKRTLQYRDRARAGDPVAQYNLARTLTYAAGHGAPQDWVEAARWCQQAALQGLVPAMVNLAVLYEKGEGLGRSLPDAYAWYRAAARGGDGAAEKRASDLFAQFSNPRKAEAVMAAAEIADMLDEAATRPSRGRSLAATGSAGPPPVLAIGGALGRTLAHTRLD